MSSAPTASNHRREAQRTLTVTVVICAYTEERWVELTRAIDSVLGQTRSADEIVVVVDHNERLFANARSAFERRDAPTVVVIENHEERGLSGARNTGIQAATSDVVAFLDDDARAHADWLAVTLSAYEHQAVVATGGLALARWGRSAPRWLPEEFYWTVGCSYRGLPARPVPIRNPIGANMSFRKDVFDEIGGFRHVLGRIGGTPLGCEETELAIRARQRDAARVVLFLPEARVDHHVAAERATQRYFYSRCWSEGVSKAVMSAMVGPQDALASERDYVMRTLPAGVMRGIADAARGDASGLLRAGNIVLGLMITAAGYIRGRARVSRQRKP